tara:strand:+ start:1243 stop:1617 length:375 start_codon:yes stop_codon:yes gene_type:complete
MKIDELKKQVQDMQEDIQTLGSELQSAEYTVDDLESCASNCRENISDCKVTVNDLDDELEVLKLNFDNLEGFDVDKVRQEVAEELIFKLTNKFGRFIKEALASDLYPDELKKAPAKKSTETDNQ